MDNISGIDDLTQLEDVATTAADAAHDLLDTYLVVAPSVDPGQSLLPVITDSDGLFAAAYGPGDRSLYVIRPDGYLGYAQHGIDAGAVVDHLKKTFS